MANSSRDDSATDGDTSSGDAPPSYSSLYSEGEKILAYHGPHIYEAKLLLFNSTFIAVSARPLNIMKYRNSVEGFFDGLSLGAIKESGPSPGEGHKLTNQQTLGGIKSSGPSPPGQGNKFTNVETLGGIKDSGPSPSSGNKFTNVETLGGIKDAGLSPGTGNKFTNVETLGGIKDSGPSPGTGNKFTDNTHQ